MTAKPRIAVISPFLDKRHGTERCVAEQIERLAGDYEIHVYASAVRDLDLSRIVWHRIPRLPGPHLLTYAWFFLSNHVIRYWGKHFQNINFDLIFSPGINCFDADIVAVHIVFAEYCRLARRELALFRNQPGVWPWLVHRRLSYQLFIALEHVLYGRNQLPLVVISRKMKEDLARCFQRTSNLHLVYHGIDPVHMNPENRKARREESRRALGIPLKAFAILLVGNDWKKKGLYCLIEAVGQLGDADLWILVRGHDDSSACERALRKFGLEGRIRFLPSIPQVDLYYAAADMYAGPSLEDSFAIPPLEAMACGLPVVVSRQAGVSELIAHGESGFILDDPKDARQLANLIDLIYRSSELRQKLGQNAAVRAKEYTWQRNAEELRAIIETILRAKRLHTSTRKQDVWART